MGGEGREELMRGGSEPQDNVSSLGWGSSLRSSQILVDRRNVWISCLVAHLLQHRQTGTCLSHWANNNFLGVGKFPTGLLCPLEGNAHVKGFVSTQLQTWVVLGGDLGRTLVFLTLFMQSWQGWYLLRGNLVRMRGKQWH